MNARAPLRIARFILQGVLAACGPAFAADGATGFVQGDGVALPQTDTHATAAIAAWTEDPLRTRPGVLDSGATLPGDRSPYPCGPDARVDNPLYLADAIDLALCNSPLVRSAWAAIKVQSAAVGEARAAYLPTVSAGLSRTSDRTRYPGLGVPATVDVGNSSNLGVSWRLFDFGGRAANRDSAEKMLDAAIASHDAALQKALEVVIGAYFDAQSTKSAYDAKLEGESLARETLETATHRESHGAGSRSETLQASASLSKASLDRSRANGDHRKALSMLVYALGLPPGTSVSLAPDLADNSRDLGQELAQWISQAQSSHPAIVAAKAQLDATRDKVAATEAEGLPTLDASFNIYRNGRPTQGLPTIQTTERVVGLTLTIPLFDGFSHKYKVRGAQAQVEQKEADVQDLEHQLLLDVLKAHADAVSALDNLDLSQGLLTASLDALDSVRRKYDRGAADILEMLSVQASLADARQQRVHCLAEWRSARLRLMAAAGVLGHAGVH
jgi:outer membrane protein